MQYLWFLSLYMLYILILIAFGSAIDLAFFRLNGYGLQIVSIKLNAALVFWQPEICCCQRIRTSSKCT